MYTTDYPSHKRVMYTGLLTAMGYYSDYGREFGNWKYYTSRGVQVFTDCTNPYQREDALFINL